MNGLQLFHCLQLDDDVLLHDHVYSVPEIELHPLVYDWERDLPSYGESSLTQLPAEAFFVCRLEQPRP
jgi:hypothetical protein